MIQILRVERFADNTYYSMDPWALFALVVVVLVLLNLASDIVMALIERYKEPYEYQAPPPPPHQKQELQSDNANRARYTGMSSDG